MHGDNTDSCLSTDKAQPCKQTFGWRMRRANGPQENREKKKKKGLHLISQETTIIDFNINGTFTKVWKAKDRTLYNRSPVLQLLSKGCVSRKTRTALFVGMSEKEPKFHKQILKTC